jgi:hypothetical protein
MYNVQYDSELDSRWRPKIAFSLLLQLLSLKTAFYCMFGTQGSNSTCQIINSFQKNLSCVPHSFTSPDIVIID